MKYTILRLVLALLFSNSLGVNNWNVWEIQQYHKFFPSRSLQEELLTIEAVENAMQELTYGFNVSLFQLVDYQKRELQTVLRHTTGTRDEECVLGLSTYVDKAVEDVLLGYEECTGEVLSRLNRMNRTLQAQWQSFNTTYRRTITNINHCVFNYADNQDSQQLIQKCVRNTERRYYEKANSIRRLYNIDNSPAMREFSGTVIECMATSFKLVVEIGFEFLEKMKCCTNSTDLEQFWIPVNNTLDGQIHDAIQQTKLQITKAEKDIKSLYSSQLLTAEKYLSSKKSSEFFHHEMSFLMMDYFKSVNITGFNNPGEGECVDYAKSKLLNISKTGGTQIFKWDLTVGGNTLQQLEKISQKMEAINGRMPLIGNVALLECFSQGYIFAPNTIKDCFDLTSSQFDLFYRESSHAIRLELEILDNYLDYFRNIFKYPLVEFIVENVFLEAEKVLYELQRCLYKSSATIYSVTTPTTTSLLPTYEYYTEYGNHSNYV